ncbi:MAG: Fe-S protein [Deltaproteobacteria bacterium]|nr:MAG: Fe-S protein [Deltaproteobacteria bacterium]
MFNAPHEFTSEIILKTKEFGADLVGVVNIEELKRSPSHSIFERLDTYTGVGSKGEGKPSLTWPKSASSIIIMALEHPEDNEPLDWWRVGFSGGTRGNRILMEIVENVAKWLKEEHSVGTCMLPYHIEHGGLFLKDAAVIAGLGIIGKSNLLVTPQLGPRVRLRALAADIELEPTSPIDFNPCRGCQSFCRKACPRNAFNEKLYLSEKYGIDKLPGRDGNYNRSLCNLQMEADIAKSKEVDGEEVGSSREVVRYCRKCEFACPVGIR